MWHFDVGSKHVERAVYSFSDSAPLVRGSFRGGLAGGSASRRRVQANSRGCQPSLSYFHTQHSFTYSGGIAKLLPRVGLSHSPGDRPCWASEGAPFGPRGRGEGPGLRVVLFGQRPLCPGLSPRGLGPACARRPRAGAAVLVVEAGGLHAKRSTVAGAPCTPDRPRSVSSLGHARGSRCWAAGAPLTPAPVPTGTSLAMEPAWPW